MLAGEDPTCKNEADWDALLKGIVKVHEDMQHKA